MATDFVPPLAPAVAALSPRRRVVAAIQGWVAQGVWHEQDWLPSEEMLAEHLDVSRSTVRAGLQELVERGLLVEERNRGRRVSTDATASAVLGETIAYVSTYRGGPVHHGMMDAIGIGVSKRLSEANLHVLSLHPRLMNDAGIERLINGRPRGVIMPPDAAESSARQNLLERLHEHGIFVVVCTDLSEGINCDRVAFDHATGCSLLVRYLHQQGHRRMLRVWGHERGLLWGLERNRGYEESCRDLGLPILPEVFLPKADSRPMEERVREAVGYLVEYMIPERRIDAIIASSDSYIKPISEACRKLGCQLPVAGYDDVWDDSSVVVSPPPIATIDKQTRLAGEEMVNLLLERLAGSLPPTPQLRMIPPRLVVPGAE